jgi:hypothetical protein
MLVVKIYGGLGNQIFQYIFGKYLEKKFNTDVVFDFYYFAKFNFRKPSLLNIIKDVKTLSDFEIHYNFNPTKSFKINSIWNKYKNYGLYYSERNFQNFKFSNSKNMNIYYFDGYWQSSKYFNFFSCEELDSFFNFDNEHCMKNVIHMHVRRGDYLVKPNNKIFFTQEIDYYNSSINLLSLKYKLTRFNTSIVIFTDDENWTKLNLKFDFDTSIISGLDYEDFVLLCCSKYLIISNSTFSCAAAFLKNKSKIVISPSKWYKDYTRNNEYKFNMYNENWIVI